MEGNEFWTYDCHDNPLVSFLDAPENIVSENGHANYDKSGGRTSRHLRGTPLLQDCRYKG